MNTWTIGANGAPLGAYPGASEADAIDAMARDAGYRDYTDLLARVPGSRPDELTADPWEHEPLPAEYDDDPIDLVECESPEAAVEMFNRTVEWVNDEACALWEEANTESSE